MPSSGQLAQPTAPTNSQANVKVGSHEHGSTVQLLAGRMQAALYVTSIGKSFADR